MEKLILKNVIGSSETATKISDDIKKYLQGLDFPVGHRALSTNWAPPKGYTLQKTKINDVIVERLMPLHKKFNKTILLFHSGGYLWPLIDIDRDLGLTMCKLTNGYEIINVDYRLAPTYPYPAAVEDCVKVYTSLLESNYKNTDIFIMGDSAGGSLALATTLYLKDHHIPLPKAIIALSPCTDITLSAPSVIINYEKDFFLGKDGCPLSKRLQRQEYLGNADSTSPYISPIQGDYTNFPPLLLQAGTSEILYDDSRLVYEKAKVAKCDVQFSAYAEMFHCFQAYVPTLPESKLAYKEIQEFIHRHSK